MILKLLLAPKPAPMQVYKKSPGTPCDQDTVIMALYAKDKVNTEYLSKVTKPRERASLSTSIHLSSTIRFQALDFLIKYDL